MLSLGVYLKKILFVNFVKRGNSPIRIFTDIFDRIYMGKAEKEL